MLIVRQAITKAFVLANLVILLEILMEKAANVSRIDFIISMSNLVSHPIFKNA